MTIICLNAGVIFFLSMFTLPTGNVVLASLSFALIGVAIIPIMSVAYAFSVELTFPVQEAMTNGTMISIALIWGTVQSVLDVALADINPRYAMLIWSITSFLGGIISLFIKGKIHNFI